MPTATIQRGRASQLFISNGGSFGTMATTGWKPTLYYSHNIKQSRPLEDDPLIGANLHNGADATIPEQGLPDAAGQIVAPFDLSHIGHWLKQCFGAPTTTGSTDLTHVFSSGAATLPTFDLEFGLSASDFEQMVSFAAKSLEFELADTPGQQRATIGVLGKKRVLASSTGTGTPAALLARERLLATKGQILVEDAALGSVMSFRGTYDNGLSVERYVDGDEFASAIARTDDAKFTFEIRVRKTGQTLEGYADARTAKKIELLWSNGAANSLSIVAGSCFLEPAGSPITGPGGMEQTYVGRASQTSAAAMVVATLKNQIAAASY
jgi:hypothetical protein